MRYKNTIVILQHNRFILTQQLLSDLSLNESENIDEIVLVDNGSTEEEAKSGARVWVKQWEKITLIEIAENVGFTIGFNTGLEYATTEIAEPKAVFAISNDVRIHGKFIQQADELLFSARRYLVGNRHIAFDSGWNHFNGKTFDYLEGFFLAMTSDGWRDVGYFDERYAPADYEDIDLSTTAKAKGYKLASLNNPNIVHQGAGTYGYNPEREAITLRNKEYFREKWMKE